jgi:ubiquinone/menaquinone biosynthesis C-methylase UbiE
MFPRVLEPEVMDSADEAINYDSMDHSEVNWQFAADFLAVWNGKNRILDVGTGTAQIPIELCRQSPIPRITAIDLAGHMLALARQNVERSGFADRIQIEKADAKCLPYRDGYSFGTVISNSIIHHIPEPSLCLAEMHRVCADGGFLFIRDLLRPADETTLGHLVDTNTRGANDHQRAMFAASLRAALTLEEVRDLVGQLGYPSRSVQQTSDRHWTFHSGRL